MIAKSDSPGSSSAADALCPAQRRTFDSLLDSFPVGEIFAVHCRDGAGRTTVLRAAHATFGGAMLTIRDLVEATDQRHPLALEEAFYRMVLDALDANDVVIVDDVQKLTHLSMGCRAYPRAGWLDAHLLALVTMAAEHGKRLIFGGDGSMPGCVSDRCYTFGVAEFKPDDYAFLCRAHLGPMLASQLDYQKIFRFAPKLDAHQIRAACAWLKSRDDAADLTTDGVIDYLRSQRMASNVDLQEVQPVDLRDLKGVDDVIQSLEANIIVPLENDALAEQLKIKPKRGVLLAGPPGTGKTTIGRALAHRLKGKFFLIDGTFISGTAQFYGRVHEVFEAAKENSPAVIFIDDSDVIFESGEEMGLYRYLLTMLDGLESASAARVCVMMTAMDVSALPPALIRSGRVELWLETRLPDEAARRSILAQHVDDLPPDLAGVDLDAVIAAADGFTGADLKRLTEDAKILYAYDRAQQRAPRPATEYFLSSVETVRSNKSRYAAAEAKARKQHPQRPPWFDVATTMMHELRE